MPTNLKPSESASARVTLTSVAVRRTDGSGLFQNLDLSFGAERIGLVGANGTGKSTLLSIVAGEVRPAEGKITVRGHLWSLDQQTSCSVSVKLAEILGVSKEWNTIQRILTGAGSKVDLENADWSLEPRIHQALMRVDLSHLDPNMVIDTLSGGERTRAALAGLMLAQPDIALLDEPTNHLDADGKEMVASLVRDWNGCMIIASHDRDLLMEVDRIVELSEGSAHLYGGNYDLYRYRKGTEKDAAQAQLDHAQKAMDQAASAVQSNREMRERRDSAGRKSADKGGMPKILLGARKRSAQQSTARQSIVPQRTFDARQAELDAATGKVERLQTVDIEIAPTGLATGRDVARADNATVVDAENRLMRPVSFHWRGPVRVAVIGANGSGKSTLLNLLAGLKTPSNGLIETFVEPVLFDQSVSMLRDDETVREAWLRLNPQGTVNQAQAALAHFLFRNTAALRTVSTLSGGERLRAGLACVLGGLKPAQFLLLDEPTNHLDLPSIEAVEKALALYDGALVVVSHDRRFLEAIGIEQTMDMSAL